MGGEPARELVTVGSGSHRGQARPSVGTCQGEAVAISLAQQLKRRVGVIAIDWVEWIRGINGVDRVQEIIGPVLVDRIVDSHAFTGVALN